MQFQTFALHVECFTHRMLYTLDALHIGCLTHRMHCNADRLAPDGVHKVSNNNKEQNLYFILLPLDSFSFLVHFRFRCPPALVEREKKDDVVITACSPDSSWNPTLYPLDEWAFILLVFSPLSWPRTNFRCYCNKTCLLRIARERLHLNAQVCWFLLVCWCVLLCIGLCWSVVHGKRLARHNRLLGEFRWIVRWVVSLDRFSGLF